jgi:hypothetical protein
MVVTLTCHMGMNSPCIIGLQETISRQLSAPKEAVAYTRLAHLGTTLMHCLTGRDVHPHDATVPGANHKQKRTELGRWGSAGGMQRPVW